MRLSDFFRMAQFKFSPATIFVQSGRVSIFLEVLAFVLTFNTFLKFMLINRDCFLLSCLFEVNYDMII